MLQAYKAVIRGNQIEWQDEAPAGLLPNQPVPVIVTLLESPPKQEAVTPNGTKVAALFEQLASINAFADIEDPAQWEREIREDRPLPGRED